MEHHFQVAHLEVERLLAEWRWLCPQPMTLVARNAFGDLFLRDEAGRIFQLEVAIGRTIQIAQTEAQFLELSGNKADRERWFAEADEFAAAGQGLKPNGDQCIGFKIPLVFAQSGSPSQAYVADLYEQVSFLGYLHRQIAELPDGSKVQLEIKP